jgi:uncharacterized damage-inducible protein DinB
MSQINPYDSFLKGQNPVSVIAATPGKLESIAQTLGPANLEKSPAPGKWSAREILCHLADCELVFAFRLRQTLAEEHHVIQPFDQEIWAKQYTAYSTSAALAVFSSVRAWNLAQIQATDPTDFSKPATHPERGTMTFQTIVETMGGHDNNHLGQLEAIVAKFATKS